MELSEQLSNYNTGEEYQIQGEEILGGKGNPHFYENAIVLRCSWRGNSGMAKHARNLIDCIKKHLPIKLEPLVFELNEPDEYNYLETITVKNVLLQIIFTTCYKLSEYFKIPHYLKNNVLVDYNQLEEYQTNVFNNTIIYTVFERDNIEVEDVNILKQLKQVWVACERNKQVLNNLGVDNVCVIPYPILEKDITSGYPKTQNFNHSKKFYNIGKWEPRKNQHALIGAFLKAFKSIENVKLFIKTSFFGEWDDYPLPEDSLNFWLKDSEVIENGWTLTYIIKTKKIFITDKDISDEKIHKIHAENNIYVSASCGEGFELSAINAKIIGNRLICVPFGGPEDYMTEDDIALKYSMQLCHEGYNWGDSNYAKVDEKHLIQSLREIYLPKEKIIDKIIVKKYGEIQVASKIIFALRCCLLSTFDLLEKEGVIL